jgi:Zn-finger protein
MEIEIEEYWWKDNTTFCVKDKDGEVWEFSNCHLKHVNFSGIDWSDSSEACTIQMTTRYSPVQYTPEVQS